VNTAGAPKGGEMLEFFPGHREWSVQTLRLVAEAQYGGADVNECWETSRRIKPGDAESWQREWQALAETVEDRAKAALAAGHRVSARQHFFRATNYFRQSDFFLPGRDPRKRDLFVRASEAFQAGARLHAPAIERIEVPCGNERYAGYFCHPAHPAPGRWPAVLMLGGADSLAEELFFFGGNQIVERSMALLLVDTPGRGSSLRLKGIPSRPDYEVPVRAAIDYLQTRPEVDPARIGVVGVSMAGYYAPRAAAFEPRIKALVLWCACYDLLQDLYEFYPPIRGQIQWILGARDDGEARQRLTQFTLRGIAGRIRCPTLVSHGAEDVLMNPAGAVRLYEEIGSTDKELKIWQGAEGGAVHCNYDNWAVSVPYMIDWIADRL
jgi:dienelactone hydrolase